MYFFSRNSNGIECMRNVGIMGTSVIHCFLSECDFVKGVLMIEMIGKKWLLALRFVSENFLEVGKNIREFRRRARWR